MIQQEQLLQELGAVREHAALFDQSFLGHLEIAGFDRVDFLNRLLSNNVKGLQPGQGQKSLLLNSKGKIAADLILYQAENSIRALLQPSLPSKVLSLLQKYIFSEKVEIADRSKEWGALSIQGLKAPELARELSAVENRAQPIHFAEFAKGGFYLVAPRAEIESLRHRVISLGKNFGLLAASPESYHLSRVEAGIPLYGAELDEDVYPQEACLGFACAKNKGCYIGQEVVARMDTYGSPPKALVGVEFDKTEPLDAGTALINEKGETVGKLTSWAFSPRVGRGIGLGYLKRGEENTRFALSGNSGATATIRPLLVPGS